MSNIRDVVYRMLGGKAPTVKDALDLFGAVLMVVLENAEKQNDVTTQRYVVTLVTLCEKVRHHFDGELSDESTAEARAALQAMRHPPTSH